MSEATHIKANPGTTRSSISSFSTTSGSSSSTGAVQEKLIIFPSCLYFLSSCLTSNCTCIFFLNYIYFIFSSDVVQVTATQLEETRSLSISVQYTVATAATLQNVLASLISGTTTLSNNLNSVSVVHAEVEIPSGRLGVVISILRQPRIGNSRFDSGLWTYMSL